MKADKVRERLRELGTRPAKRLGQHFLLQEDLVRRMVAWADIRREETVLEVGPGLGVLTASLLEAADRVVAVELDPRLAAHLRERFPDLSLIEGDVLEVDLPPFERVVSNLPFEISSPFLLKLLERPFRRAVLTVQREFAHRMVASPGTRDYSRLTVKVYARCEAQVLTRVPRSAFWPRPRVEAATVRLDPRPPSFPVDEGFHRVVDALFAHRRKQARNALKLAPDLALSAEEVEAALEGTEWASRRAGEMTPEEMAALARHLDAAKG